jgi:hypothetical protein
MTCNLPRAPGSGVATRGNAWRALMLVVSCASLIACDIPTAAPKWDVKFMVPSKGTSLSVGQLLPSSVIVTSDASAFQINLAPTTFSRTLGELCPPCIAVNGLFVPKPAFTGTLSGSVSLPAEVVNAQVQSGGVDVSVRNNLSFDPIRPSATARGTVTISISSGGVQIGAATISGTTTALAPGSTVVFPTVQLTANATITNPISVSLTLDSPAGDNVTVNTSQSITVTATPNLLRVKNVRVTVANRTVAVSQVDLNLQDVDKVFVNRIQGGTLFMDIANPFAGVTGTLNVRITAPNSSPIVKPIALNGLATQTVSIVFTRDELRSFVGKNGAILTATGTLNGPNGGVPLAPNQVVVISSRFELILSSTEN